MSRTALPEHRLVQLRAEGKAKAGRFVDPHVIAKCRRILTQRGEQWAASVLGRDLSRRSLMFPRLPWLNDGEEHVLVLADSAEDEHLLESRGDQ